MAGSGFFRATTSPANTSIPEASPAPRTVSMTALTDSGADVEATATFHPEAVASMTSLRIPGRAGTRPSATIPRNSSVLSAWTSATSLARSPGVSSRPRAAITSGDSTEERRSLPPPMPSSLA